MKMKNLVLAAVALLAMGAVARAGEVSVTPGGVILTYAQDPGVMDAPTASLPGISVETFNTGATSSTKYTNFVWSGVGTYDQVCVMPTNEYGGADNSDFCVQSANEGSPNNVTKTTLTLNSNSQYFGMWWSAGDANNYLTFYNGDTIVAAFSTATLLDQLKANSGGNSSPYLGNPNTGTNHGKDSGEMFAYINFFASDADTSWNKIVLYDPNSSGFESDNHADLTTWTYGSSPMPGNPLEEVTGGTANSGAGSTEVLLDGTTDGSPDYTYSAGGVASDGSSAVPEPTIIGGLLVTLAASGVILGKRKTINV